MAEGSRLLSGWLGKTGPEVRILSSPPVASASARSAPLAQLDRASDYGSEGWGFKSSRARHFIVFAACLLLLAGPASAAKRTADLFWTHPDFARAGIQSIAMLTVASYDHNAQTQGLVGSAWGQQFQGAGYRWMTAGSTATLIRLAGGDSLVRLVEKGLLDRGRPDSLVTPMLCARFHVNALLSLRVDRWEQIAVEEDQRGKPSSTVALTAALVDSSGRLVWRGSGTETVEGIEHIPSTSGTGSRIGEVQLSASSADTRPPAFAEVLTRLLTRWGDQFPARVAPPATPAAADTTRPH